LVFRGNNQEEVKEIVKILEENEKSVRYKMWHNQSGPTWVKKRENIRSIAYYKEKNIALIEPIPSVHSTVDLDFTLCNPDSKKVAKRKKTIPSGNEIVHFIDSVYNKKKLSGIGEITEYVSGLPLEISRDCIIRYYHEQYHSACEIEDKAEIIHNGCVYLLLDAEEELPEIITMIAKLMAAEGDEKQVGVLMEAFRRYSESNDHFFDADVERLIQEINVLLHPRIFENEVKGKWVALNSILVEESNSKNSSPLVIIIDDVTQNNGAKIFLPNCSNNNKDINTSKSIVFDGNEFRLLLQFASEKIKDRRENSEYVHDALEYNKQVEAQINAETWASDGSYSEKVAAVLLTSLVMAIFNGIVNLANVSSDTKEVYSFDLISQTPVLLDAQVSHVKATTYSNGNTSYDDYTQDAKASFVKWEESDSIYFITSKNLPMPLTPNVIEKDFFKDFYYINEQYSFWKQPKFWAISLLGYATGTALIVSGFSEGLNSHKGLVKFLGGSAAMTLTFSYTTLYRITKRKEAFKGINERNLEKLRRKAEQSLSLSPTYYPNEKGIGATVSFTF